MICLSVSLLGCGSKKAADNSSKEKVNEEEVFQKKVKNSVIAISKSEEAIDLDKFEETSKDNKVYSFEIQDLIDSSKNKTIVFSTTLDDIAKVNNDYYLYISYPLCNSSLLLKLKCNSEQLDKFVQDKKKHKSKGDDLGYIFVAKVNRSFKSKLNLSSDVTDKDPESPISEIVIDFQNVLIVEGELIKTISHESIK